MSDARDEFVRLQQVTLTTAGASGWCMRWARPT